MLLRQTTENNHTCTCTLTPGWYAHPIKDTAAGSNTIIIIMYMLHVRPVLVGQIWWMKVEKAKAYEV